KQEPSRQAAVAGERRSGRHAEWSIPGTRGHTLGAALGRAGGRNDRREPEQEAEEERAADHRSAHRRATSAAISARGSPLLLSRRSVSQHRRIRRAKWASERSVELVSVSITLGGRRSRRGTPPTDRPRRRAPTAIHVVLTSRTRSASRSGASSVASRR